MSNIVAIRNVLAGWVNAINQAASTAPGNVLSLAETNQLRDALAAALAALDVVKQSEEAIPLVFQDPDLSGQAKFNRAAGGHDAAVKAAQSALATLQSIADRVSQRVSSAWTPKRPAGVSDALVMDRKADVALIALGAGEDPTKIVGQVTQLLRDAQADGSDDAQLTAFVVAGGPMALWYRGRGVTPEMLAGAFASVAGSDGGKFQPLVGRGSTTLQGFVQTAQSQLRQSVDDTRAVLSNMVGVLANDDGNSYNSYGLPTASIDPSSRYLRRRGQ